MVVVVFGAGQCVRGVYVRVCHLLLVLHGADVGIAAVLDVLWIYVYDVVCMLFDAGCGRTLVVQVVCGAHL